MPKPLDHLVLPVRDLETASNRLSALGFTVAPVGTHPFGTVNACVFFADGTFLEPIAIGQRETAEEAARAGNAFVARIMAYRFRVAEDGFCALVMGSDDADDDHRRFVATGHSGGDIVSFSRPFKTSAGDEDTASFKLAFAADLRAPDAFAFTCERINVPAVDRSALQRHENGVLSISEIVAVEQNPTDFQYLLQEVVAERKVEASSFGMRIVTGGAAISVITPEGFSAFFGAAIELPTRGMQFMAIVYKVAKLETVKSLLDRAAVSYQMVGQRLVVQPAVGQGAYFAFEEQEPAA
jgi:hypothetical protein